MQTFRLSLPEFADLVSLGDGTHCLQTMLCLLEVDPVERRVVDDLVRQLRRDGRFRDPIVLLDEGGRVRIGDGRHRTAAHFRAGTGPVAVTFGYDRSDPCECSFRVTFELSGAPHDGMPLRSFAVGDSWAVADVSSTLDADPTGAVQVVCYSYWAPGCRVEDVVSSAVRRAAELGFTARVLDAREEPPRD